MTGVELVRIERLKDGDVIVSNGERHTVNLITGQAISANNSRRGTVRWSVYCVDGYTFRQNHGYEIKVAR